MQDLNDLYYFAKVVEKGSFAAAARSLGLPKSRLSRRVALLESVLGVRLLQRTTRRLALTDVGRLYYQHAQNVMAEADAAAEAVDRVRRVPSGLLRVSCLVGLAQSEVGTMVPEFLTAYPEVNLDLIVTNRRVQLIEEGVDIALRVRAADDEEPGLVVRRLQPAPLMLVVHPEVLEDRGPIDDPDDLDQLPMMGFGSPDGTTRLALVGPGGARRDVALPARLMTDSFEVLRDSALAGLGATMLPAAFCLDDIRAGRLVPLLADWSQPPATLQAVYVSRRGMVPAVRAFLDLLMTKFAAVEGG